MRKSVDTDERQRARIARARAQLSRSRRAAVRLVRLGPAAAGSLVGLKGLSRSDRECGTVWNVLSIGGACYLDSWLRDKHFDDILMNLLVLEDGFGGVGGLGGMVLVVLGDAFDDLGGDFGNFAT